MSTESSFRNAAQLLTTLSMRPDLATRIPDLHFGLQLDYQQLLDLQERRRGLARELATCEAGLARLRAAVQQRIVATRFALRDPAVQLSLPTPRAVAA